METYQGLSCMRCFKYAACSRCTNLQLLQTLRQLCELLCSPRPARGFCSLRIGWGSTHGRWQVYSEFRWASPDSADCYFACSLTLVLWRAPFIFLSHLLQAIVVCLQACSSLVGCSASEIFRGMPYCQLQLTLPSQASTSLSCRVLPSSFRLLHQE